MVTSPFSGVPNAPLHPCSQAFKWRIRKGAKIVQAAPKEFYTWYNEKQKYKDITKAAVKSRYKRMTNFYIFETLSVVFLFLAAAISTDDSLYGTVLPIPLLTLSGLSCANGITIIVKKSEDEKQLKELYYGKNPAQSRLNNNNIGFKLSMDF